MYKAKGYNTEMLWCWQHLFIYISLNITEWMSTESEKSIFHVRRSASWNKYVNMQTVTTETKAR